MYEEKKKVSWMKKAMGVVGIIAGICIMLFIYLMPATANVIIFKMILTNAIYLVPIAMGYPAFRVIRKLFQDKYTRVLDLCVLICFGIIMLAGIIGIYTMTDYITYQMYAKFDKRTEILKSDTSAIRYTPIHIAAGLLDKSITEATEDLEPESVQPISINGQMKYIGPVIPEGIAQMFFKNMPGFMVYEDNAESNGKVHRINQEFQIGPGMYFFDNLERNLYLTDWFADYEDPHYLALNPNNPNEITIAVPKIKYMLWRFPYWAGVVLVHADGKIEDLSKEEALNDARLKGQWIAPMKLAENYIGLQNYQVGYIKSFFKVEGKIKIPNLEGKNQFPFYTKAEDRHDYFVTAAQAEGAGGGVYRMYYVDSYDFKLSFFQLPKDRVTYGPSTAMDQVKGLPNYNWSQFKVIEPVYVTKDNDLWWKLSIVPENMRSVSQTVLVNANDVNQIQKFNGRQGFQDWLTNKQSEGANEESAPTTSDKISTLRRMAEDLLNQIKALEEEIK